MSKIETCWGCVPPKRHSGCHSTCPDHIEAKAIHDRNLEIEQLESRTFISDVDFEKRQEAAQSAKSYKKMRGKKQCG